MLLKPKPNLPTAFTIESSRRTKVAKACKCGLRQTWNTSGLPLRINKRQHAEAYRGKYAVKLTRNCDWDPMFWDELPFAFHVHFRGSATVVVKDGSSMSRRVAAFHVAEGLVVGMARLSRCQNA